MASSKAGLANAQWTGTHHCENCGNNIEEFFFMTTNHSSDPSDITCIKCGTTSPIGNTIPMFPSRKDPPGDTTGSADDFSQQPVKNIDDVPVFPSRKTSRGNNCATETCRSKRHKLKAGVSVSPQTSTEATDRASPMNLQIDLAKAKSSFFSQACSCGSSDRSDFLYITDNEDGEIMMRECKKCSDTIGLDDTTYDEVLSWMDDSENIRVSICDCRNENPDTFVFELLGGDIVLRCGKCRKTIPVLQEDDKKEDCVVTKRSESRVSCSDADPPLCDCTCLSRSTSTEALASFGCTCVGHPCGRTKIEPTSVGKLNPGDHLAWHRPLGYWHHAIVVRSSSVVDTTVRVIHYAEPTTTSTCKGKIVEDWIDMCKQRGDLYRLEYKRDTVFDGDMVIERGRTRLGEVQYNVFDNNCEHFARWCKTGVGKSEQVESFTSTLKRIGHKTLVNMGAKTARNLIGRSIHMLQAMSKWKSGKLSLTGMSAPSGATVAKSTGRELTRKQACSVVTGAVAFTFIVGIEVYSLYHDMKKAQHQHWQGDISQQVYINIVVKRTCRAVGAVVGATAGAVVPIPVVGTLIGSTLGSLIGEGVGALAGRHTLALLPAKVKN